MAVFDVRSGNTRALILFSFILLLVTAGQLAIPAAADAAPKEFQNILNDTLKALWTGQESSPELDLSLSPPQQKKLFFFFKKNTPGRAPPPLFPPYGLGKI